jgi:hypothetical protein
MLVFMQLSPLSAQLPRRSMNDQWGELTRIGFDELCMHACLHLFP